MDAREALFNFKRIYDQKSSEQLFINAVRNNVDYHSRNCGFYSELLKKEGYKAGSINTIQDCFSIPVIPASLFKYHEILSIPKDKVSVHATSSGTQGQKSQMFFDEETLRLGTRMVINCFKYHGLISAVPANYLMLGYEPSDDNEMGAVKTAMGVTRFAPALNRVFVLKKTSEGYLPDWFGVLDALRRFSQLKLPVRFVGFPGFLYRLLTKLKSEGISFRLNKSSRILLGGGWKQFTDETINKLSLYNMAEELLGIPAQRCTDFYSAVEHGIAYAECKNHNMHVPVWSRVIIRDIKTLEPLRFDNQGFLSFVTPLFKSAPLTSLLMGDLAVMHDGRECGCGIESAYFEVLGRAGLTSAKSCSISADELAGGVK